MTPLVLDTNVVSILFNRNHPLRGKCISVVAGHQLAISFMTRAELLLWPVANQGGSPRRSALAEHISKYLTLYADENTCELWSRIVDKSRRAGRPIQTADAWIACAALQWRCPLVTTDFRDYESVEEIEVIPIG